MLHIMYKTEQNYYSYQVTRLYSLSKRQSSIQFNSTIYYDHGDILRKRQKNITSALQRRKLQPTSYLRAIRLVELTSNEGGCYESPITLLILEKTSWHNQSA
jgi:hypothetical protein